jgi:ABC-type multidrug transport system ATPase subunit
MNLQLGSHDSAQDEENRVRLLESEGVAVEGMRIIGLDKVYRHRLCGKSARDIHAVKQLYLNVHQNELLGLLGHNGAGKTTLLSMLTGLINPSHGTASIFGYDLQDDIGEIRKFMGYCPQHNVLWDELTAREHLTLFAILKHVAKESVEESVTQKLKEVELEDVGDCPVFTYSGGMKRRLSVAIAGTGNPGVIFLDEPTTGLDPISRRFVWDVIKDMKKNRVVILTTHSMEEAEVLSDRIAVMAGGRVKCIGNSLYLKTRYGDGYQISLTSKQPEAVKELQSKHFPAVKLMQESAGSLIYAVSYDDLPYLMPFLMELEARDGVFSGVVEEWIISHSTLEDVFMKVTTEYASLDKC